MFYVATNSWPLSLARHRLAEAEESLAAMAAQLDASHSEQQAARREVRKHMYPNMATALVLFVDPCTTPGCCLQHSAPRSPLIDYNLRLASVAVWTALASAHHACFQALCCLIAPGLAAPRYSSCYAQLVVAALGVP